MLNGGNAIQIHFFALWPFVMVRKSVRYHRSGSDRAVAVDRQPRRPILLEIALCPNRRGSRGAGARNAIEHQRSLLHRRISSRGGLRRQQLLQAAIDDPFSILQPFVDFLLQLLQPVTELY